MPHARHLHASLLPALVGLASALACGYRVEMAPSQDSGALETSETSSAAEPGDTSASPGRTDESEGGDADGGAQQTSVGFIEDPDGGSVHIQCDIWAQDCPNGEKCNFYANDGGGSWNATKCVPIDPDADEIGEPCSVVESGVSGIDSCVLGAMCWYVDSETNLGRCVGFCTGSEANPMCADPSMHCVGRDFMICLPSCCPLEQDCHEGEACYPVLDTFECVHDAGGEEGAYGDACEFINVCDPGLFCANSEAVLGCGGNVGCCSYFCNIGSQNCALLNPAMDCLPWFEEGQAPPGEEHIGACMIPS